MLTKLRQLLHNIYFQSGLSMYVASFEVMAMSILGPSFPDLQRIYQMSLSQISVMMLVLYLGAIVGALGATYIFSCHEAKAVLSVCLFISAGTLTSVPVAGSYALLLFVVFWLGASLAVLSTGGYCQMNTLWPSSPTCFHVLGLGFAVGGIISPFLVVPFLCDSRFLSPVLNTTDSSSHCQYIPTTWNNSGNYLLYFNDTDPGAENDSVSQNILIDRDTTSCNAGLVIPYALLGSLNIIPSVIFVCLHMFPNEQYTLQVSSHESIPETNSPKHYTLYSCMFTTAIVICCAPAYSIGLTYGQYLVTFGLDTGLDLSAQTLSEMTGIFWLSMLFGKCVVLCLAKRVSPAKIMFAGITGLSVLLVLLCLWAVNSSTGLWIASIAFGALSGYYFNCIVEWGRQVVEFPPFVMCLCCFGDRAGTLVIVYLCGILMDTYGYMFFAYVLMFALSLIWILVLCMSMLSKLLVGT
ncbi:sodium-dependent glucose transporter 1A-like [Haliotis asinina]|uniref:sodium-dependent glucose transporter 1A-like n=1 Tax=Haliotis asinina TaxID=109174 RepID=UPI0035326DE2